MDRIEAVTLLQEIKHYLTTGNPVWDVDEIAEALDMAIEALRNEINCVKCQYYTERETYTGIKGVCKMDTAHREDLISRSRAIKDISYWATNIIDPKMLVKEDALYILESLPSAETPTVSEKHQLSEETPTNTSTDFNKRAREMAEGFIMSANEIAEINHWQKDLFVEQVKRYMRGEEE